MRKSAAIIHVERQWLVACAAFAIGVYFGLCARTFSSLIVVPILALIFTSLCGFGFSIRWWWVGTIFFFGVLVAFLDVSARKDILEEAHGWNAHSPLTIEARVLEDAKIYFAKNGERRMSFPSSVRGMIVNISCAFRENEALPRRGEIWRCTGWLSGWGEDDIFMKRNFWLRGSRCSMEKVSSGWSGLYSILSAIKANVANRLSIGIDERTPGGNFPKAIILGDKTVIPQEAFEAFVSSGVVHVFAISGLHVMVFVKMLFLIVGMFVPYMHVRILLVLPFAWLYVLMVGSPISAVRAATMVSFYYSSFFFYRRANGVVAWSLSFLVCHIVSPLLLLDVGSNLSFVVMFALVISSRILSSLNCNRFTSFVCVSMAAWAAGLPIIASFFGRLTFAGLWTGLFAVPAASCVVILGFSGIVFSFISNTIASYVNNFASLIIGLMSGLCEIIACIPGLDIEINDWSMFQSMSWYLSLGLIFYYFMLRRDVKI